jgi:DNA integrity scanning protein DisA with diadenylate cyclase activity
MDTQNVLKKHWHDMLKKKLKELGHEENMVVITLDTVINDLINECQIFPEDILRESDETIDELFTSIKEYLEGDAMPRAEVVKISYDDFMEK